MAVARDEIPILVDEIGTPGDGLLTTDDLEKQDIPIRETTFNTCTRSGRDRRQGEERRRRLRPDCEDRRCGRDRRIFSYY